MSYVQRGYAVLLTTVMLSFAGIFYTLNMASLQIIDNKVLGNYYRNNEAFVNAESGINLILNKLNSIDASQKILSSLPWTYSPASSPRLYTAMVSRIGKNNKLLISSTGLSVDGSASRTISVKVYANLSFNIPDAALLSNGQLVIDESNSINDGCEGLSKANCRSPGSIAKLIMVSQPSELLQQCLAGTSTDNAKINSIDERAIQGQLLDLNGYTRLKEIAQNQWGNASVSAGDIFGNIMPIQNPNKAGTLFERTFGTTWERTKKEFIKQPAVAVIDMSLKTGLSCSRQLQNVRKETNIIYIKGDCSVESYYKSKVLNFNIGSYDYPKMVFMEGGRFVLSENQNVLVNGILYLIPEQTDVIDMNGDFVYVDGIKQTQQEQVIELAGIDIKGALLSEYNCSVSQQGKNKRRSLSIRYDKNRLNRLYGKLGMPVVGVNYQLVAGSWKDF